ncbi:MAG TPA: hypothetical protein VKB47_17685 [Terracidiphilus sp.]|nr:hypothetical protein [Terracidiphilus sp.]
MTKKKVCTSKQPLSIQPTEDRTWDQCFEDDTWDQCLEDARKSWLDDARAYVKAFGEQEGQESERLKVLSNEWFARLPLEKQKALLELCNRLGFPRHKPSMS